MASRGTRQRRPARREASAQRPFGTIRTPSRRVQRLPTTSQVGLALSVTGLAVAGYLAIVHVTSASLLACAGGGLVDCEKVTTSTAATVAGMPVAFMGVVWFAAMVALNLPAAWRSRTPTVRGARLGLCVAGMAFVLWLIYAELFVIGAICLWCTVVHAVTFGLFVLIMLEASSSRR
jgi:uncharacterized membrane protein